MGFVTVIVNVHSYGAVSLHAANSKHWFTTSFLWRKVPESEAWSVFLDVFRRNAVFCTNLTFLLGPILSGQCSPMQTGRYVEEDTWFILHIETLPSNRC